MTVHAIPSPLRLRIRFGFRLRLHESEAQQGISAQASEPESPEPLPKLPPVVPSSLRSSSNPSLPPSPPVSGRPPLPPSRIKSRANWLAARLTNRDWEILGTLYRLNSATIGHIYRLHFNGLTMRNCQYVMRRLMEWRAVTSIERRMGGVLSGSGQRVYFLDPAAIRLLRLAEGRKDIRDSTEAPSGRWSYKHALTVSELYVQCVEAVREGSIQLADFVTEPACWLADGIGGHLRPDAYIKVAVPGTKRRQHWWVEVDLGTESLPIVRAKFDTYMQFKSRNIGGPEGTVPRVLVTVEEESRRIALKRLVTRMGDDANRFIHIVQFEAAVPLLAAFAMPNHPG